MKKADKCEFKSADELGLTQKEWAALIKTLALLDNDAIVHVPEIRWERAARKGEAVSVRPVFNMAVWHDENACGTVMCIGGSAEYFGKLRDDQLSEKANRMARSGEYALYNLFYPPGLIDYDKLTTKMAAEALRIYLTGGHANSWDRAIDKLGVANKVAEEDSP